MLEIKNQVNSDGTVCFNATGGSSLLIKVEDNKADVIELKADDADIYDGLVKTAYAYALRRGIAFNKDGIIWKESKCN